MGEAAYLRLLKAVPQGWGLNCSAATREFEWVELVHRYTWALPMPTSSGSGGAAAAPVVYYCALSYGNLACLANDCLEAPQADGAEGERAVGAPNAAVVMLLAGGLPVPFLVCVRAIAGGDEVTVGYGPSYWSAWRHLRRRTDVAAAASGGGAAVVR